LAEQSAVVAAIAGAAMVLSGALLALAGRPESALVWGGTVLLGVALLNNVIASLEWGPTGGKVTTREKQKAIEEIVNRAPASMPVLSPEPRGAGESPTYVVGQPYWSQTVLEGITSAIGSNSRTDFEHQLDNLRGQVARPTAVVKIADAGQAAATGTAFDATIRTDEGR